MRAINALACAFALAGCTTSANYVMSEYSGVSVVTFSVEGEDDYRVFDKPAQNKRMITPSLGKAMGAGAIAGATFGGVSAMDAIGPKPVYERASLAYLASTGRQCRIVDGYPVITGQYEFKYDCSPVVAAPAAPTRRR